MTKKSIPVSNDFCPQTLFLYGTYDSEGKPDFGMFCWVSYFWGENLGVMAAICEDKRTRDNIRRSGRFSMGLVTEDMLPLADYFGNKSGYDHDKMNIGLDIEKGRVLDVPVLANCPWTFELEVDKTFKADSADNSSQVNVYLCKICNVLADESLCDKNISNEEKLNALRPVHYACNQYYAWNGKYLAAPGEPMKKGEFYK